MLPKGVPPGPQQRIQANATGGTRRIILPKLPKPDGMVVALEYELLPQTDQLLREILKRCPWLQDDTFIEWFGRMRSHEMPKADPNEPGKGICGGCTCNIFGNPMKKHSMEQCGVPMAVRARFMAVNTRSVCYSCNGKSDSHDVCIRKDVICGQCEANGLGRRNHTPLTGACTIPFGCEHEQVSIWRKVHYRKVECESNEEPLEIKLPNDSPLQSPPRKCKYAIIGHQAFFDERQMFGTVRYVEYANYPGIIPQSEKDQRKEVDKRIRHLQKEYYKIDQPYRPRPPPEIQQRLQEYRDTMEQIKRARREGQRVEIVEEEDSDEENDHSNEVQQIQHNQMSNQKQEDARRDESVERQNAQKDREQSQQYLNEIALWYISHRSPKQDPNQSQYILTEDESNEQFWLHARRVTAQIKDCPKHVKETWTRVAQHKIAVEKVEPVRGMSDTHRVNKRELKETLERMASIKTGNTMEYCMTLQWILAGIREEIEVFDDKNIEKDSTDWRRGYMELIVRLATIVSLSNAEVSAKLTTGNIGFSDYQTPGKGPILVPDSSLYKALPIEEREAFFAIFSINLANYLL